jgi:hypothetical protein
MARIGFVSDVQEVFTLPASSLDIQVWQIPDRQLKSGRSPVEFGEVEKALD